LDAGSGQIVAALLTGKEVGDGLRSRSDDRRVTEMDVAVHALNCMAEFGRPNYVRTA